MIIEEISVVAARGKMPELGRSLASLRGPIQVQPGCLGCRLFQGWLTVGELKLEAHWENKDDLIRYLQSDTYKQLLLLMELSAVPPVLKFYTVMEVQGLDLVTAAREGAKTTHEQTSR